MCGIVGVVGTLSPLEAVVFEGLKKLEYRGYDSWGIARIHEGKVFNSRHVGAISLASFTAQPSTLALGHTRWATHGGISEKNAHPHIAEDGRFALVHNGIVENYAHLKQELLTRKHVFASETDTEVLVHLLEEALKKNSLEKALTEVMSLITGANAIVVIDATTQSLGAVTSGSPLVIGKEADRYIVSSDSVGLPSSVASIHYIKPGEVVVVNQESIVPFEWQSFEQEKLSGAKTEAHFMLQEMRQQPAVIRTLLQLDRRPLQKEVVGNAIITGAGSAYHAALFGTYVLAKQGIMAEAKIASEFGHWVDTVPQNTWVYLLSQSGETADVLAILQPLRERGIHCVAVVNREQSQLARLSNEVIGLKAGIEQAVLATKSFTAKMVTLMQLAGVKSDDIAMAIGDIETLVSTSSLTTIIEPIAALLSRFTTRMITGRGASYPMALEMALKIKEVSYLPTEALAGGELKHGPIAMVDSSFCCIALCPQDETYDAMMSSVTEIKARGGFVIGVSAKNRSEFDAWIPVPDRGLGTHLTQAVVGQLLGYKTAVLLDLNPDRPRNLAKSVTVK